MNKRIIGYRVQVEHLQNRLVKCKSLEHFNKLEKSVEDLIKVINYRISREDNKDYIFHYNDIYTDLIIILEDIYDKKKPFKKLEELTDILKRINKDFGIDYKYYFNLGKGDLYKNELL